MKMPVSDDPFEKLGIPYWSPTECEAEGERQSTCTSTIHHYLNIEHALQFERNKILNFRVNFEFTVLRVLQYSKGCGDSIVAPVHPLTPLPAYPRIHSPPLPQ